MKKKDPSSGFSTESKCASYAGFIKQFKKNSKINSIVSGEISEVENWVISDFGRLCSIPHGPEFD